MLARIRLPLEMLAVTWLAVPFDMIVPAYAQETPPPRIEPVVVTATKVETPQERLGASVTVITEEELRSSNYTRVEDALRSVPGVEVQRQGGPGKLTNVTIRGASVNQVQVLIDGVRVKSPTLGQFDFSDLSLDAIDRIEIVRGPQSTLYGADAIGGVINIITKKGSGPPSGFVSSEGGSFNTFREQVGTSGAFGPFNFSLSTSKFDSQGQERTFKNDDSDQRSIVARFGVDFPWQGSATLSGRYTKTDIDVPFQGFAPFNRDPDQRQQTEFYMFNLRYDQVVMPWWKLAARMGYFWNNQGFENGPLPPGDFAFVSQVNTRRREWELLNTWDITKIDTLTVGLEYRTEEGENRQTFKADTTTKSFFLHDELRLFERAFLGGGFRYENNSAFGEEVTPRVSIAVPIKETDTKLRGGWGKGFRAPTINDLFFPDTTGGFCPPFGNPSLRPERSTSWDAGVDQAAWNKRVRLGVTYFNNDFRDLITTVFPTPFCAQAGNIGHARTSGEELTTEVEPLDWLMVRTSYTHLHTEDVSTGNELPHHAEHQGSVSITVTPMKRVSLFTQAYFVTRQFDNSANRQNPGYYRVDAGGTVRLFERVGRLDQVDLTIRVQNLTDEHYTEAFGFRAQGFNALAGVKVYFK